jgi:hypothetical protein
MISGYWLTATRTGLAKSVLGAIFRDQGNYEDSLTMLKEALQQFVQTFGEKNDNVASTRASLGETYLKMGQDLFAK